MKLKALLIAAVGMICCLSGYARDNYSTNVSVLPDGAKAILSTYFTQDVNHIKIDKDVRGVKGYDVVLNDGTEVEFDSKGNIKEVECGVKGQVPDGLIMKQIRDYVTANFPKEKIVKFEIKRGGYEIELQSGTDLVFNNQGAFKRIDR